MSPTNDELQKLSEDEIRRQSGSRHEQGNLDIIQNYFATITSLRCSNPRKDRQYRRVAGEINSQPVHYLERRWFNIYVPDPNDIKLANYAVIIAPGGYTASPSGDVGGDYEAIAGDKKFPWIMVRPNEKGVSGELYLSWNTVRNDAEATKAKDSLLPEVKTLIDFGQKVLSSSDAAELGDCCIQFNLGTLPSGGDLESIIFYAGMNSRFSSANRMSAPNIFPKGTVKKVFKFDRKREGIPISWPPTLLEKKDSSKMVASILKLLPIEPVNQLISQHDQLFAEQNPKPPSDSEVS